ISETGHTSLHTRVHIPGGPCTHHKCGRAVVYITLTSVHCRVHTGEKPH
ncbi:hypothetical protein DBR06_SOUSAS1810068, partial [Sousa chinensis]